jgi:methylamine dehydrogenase accessory protein MauD
VTALAVSNATLWLVVIVLSIALAPTVAVQDLEGRALNLGAARNDERATLIMFVSPTCPVCKTLLPALKSSLSAEREWLDIVLASDGDPAIQREFVQAHRLGSFPYVVSAPLGISFEVSRLPFAALIDAQGVLRARGIINSREHLESLFEAKRLGFASIQDYFEAAARNQAA